MTAVAEQLDLLDALAAGAAPAPVRRRPAGRTTPGVGGAVIWTERLRNWTAPRNRRALAHLSEKERAATEAWPLVWLADLHAFPSSCTACHAEEGNCFLQDLNHGSSTGRRAATGGLDQTSALAWANAPAAEQAVRAGQDGAS